MAKATPVLLYDEDIDGMEDLETGVFIRFGCCAGTRFSPCRNAVEVPAPLVESPVELSGFLDDAGWGLVLYSAFPLEAGTPIRDPETGEEAGTLEEAVDVPVLAAVCRVHRRNLEAEQGEEGEDDGEEEGEGA